jgi:hypothetical protein
MSNVRSELRKEWLEHPRKKVDLIVRVKGDLDERSATLVGRGAEVRYRFRLTGSLALRCTGRVALALLEEPWVERVEPDRPVKAFRR